MRIWGCAGKRYFLANFLAEVFSLGQKLNFEKSKLIYLTWIIADLCTKIADTMP